MKILSYSIEGDLVRVVTDNKGRSDFVYDCNQFGSIDDLSCEIMKSISLEKVRKDKKDLKLSSLSKDFSDSKVSLTSVDVVEEVVL